MQYTGEIQTAFCGSVGELKELPGVVSAWLSAQDGEYRTTDVDEEMETFCSLLRKSLEEQMENPTDPSAVVAFECDSELALVILDCINGIAKAKPALKIAVAAKIHFPSAMQLDTTPIIPPAERTQSARPARGAAWTDWTVFWRTERRRSWKYCCNIRRRMGPSGS